MAHGSSAQTNALQAFLQILAEEYEAAGVALLLFALRELAE